MAGNLYIMNVARSFHAISKANVEIAGKKLTHFDGPISNCQPIDILIS